jgi:hypothetical protein
MPLPVSTGCLNLDVQNARRHVSGRKRQSGVRILARLLAVEFRRRYRWLDSR